MNPPERDVCQAILEALCTHTQASVVLTDAGGSVVWANRFTEQSFPGFFATGRSFATALNHATALESGGLSMSQFSGGLTEGELRRAAFPGSDGSVYRHVCLPMEGAGTGFVLHTLRNASHERRLREHFVQNLQQLKIMKEIVDVLYQSLGTQEVIYLILVAVTSQIGLGFNRAFFLHVKGNRLRGRIGIGPSNHEEAHQIWTRIASLNFSSLREVYNDLTRNGGVPDPRTQEMALQLDFDLSQIRSDAAEAQEGLSGHAYLPGLLGVLERGRPACLQASEATTPLDRSLFQMLSTEVIAIVPLVVRGRLAGVIIADNFINRRQVTDADLNMLKTFAGYAGVALERSYLYDELRESIAKLKSANESLKDNQEKLLQAEKLSAIGELAAYVSHEIRNPLVAIGGLARSLLKDEISNPDTVETLDIIVSEVNRLERFLKDTLDYVKPRTAFPMPMDLNAVARDCLATFKTELATSSIEVMQDLPQDTIEGDVDPDLLVHALSNVFKNAIEAVGPGGKIYLATRREGTSASILVGDSGPGIPSELVPRIFDPFFTTKREGTGLGLALASQNVRSMGGRLELTRIEGWSTIFKLTLPLAKVREIVSRKEPLEAMV